MRQHRDGAAGRRPPLGVSYLRMPFSWLGAYRGGAMLTSPIISPVPAAGSGEGFICRNEGFNGCLFDRADHAFGLPVGPRVIWLGQPVLNVVLQAHTTEDMREASLDVRSTAT